jgi:hypothetical protein
MPATVKQLRQQAKAWNIKGYSRMTKAQLVVAIEDAGTLAPLPDDPAEFQDLLASLRAEIANTWNAG